MSVRTDLQNFVIESDTQLNIFDEFLYVVSVYPKTKTRRPVFTVSHQNYETALQMAVKYINQENS